MVSLFTQFIHGSIQFYLFYVITKVFKSNFSFYFIFNQRAGKDQLKAFNHL